MNHKHITKYFDYIYIQGLSKKSRRHLNLQDISSSDYFDNYMLRLYFTRESFEEIGSSRNESAQFSVVQSQPIEVPPSALRTGIPAGQSLQFNGSVSVLMSFYFICWSFIIRYARFK